MKKFVIFLQVTVDLILLLILIASLVGMFTVGTGADENLGSIGGAAILFIVSIFAFLLGTIGALVHRHTQEQTDPDAHKLKMSSSFILILSGVSFVISLLLLRTL